MKDVSMKKMEERDRRKMDEMKKKLHTDDEGKVFKSMSNAPSTFCFLKKTPRRSFSTNPISVPKPS